MHPKIFPIVEARTKSSDGIAAANREFEMFIEFEYESHAEQSSFTTRLIRMTLINRIRWHVVAHRSVREHPK